jgi:fatty acid/phospholipid biosynthesis enzyme
MANMNYTHQTALAFFEAFKRLPSEVKEEIEILIAQSRVKSKKTDETAYLLRNKNSKASLQKAIENVDNRQNLVEYSPEEWDNFVKQTLQKIEK